MSATSSGLISIWTREFVLKDGRRLTNELADQIADETLAAVRRRNLIPGGKSLSGG